MPTAGIHLIWTTYGTWLPGDPRGHWSPLFDLYGKIRRRGGQLNEADLTTRRYTTGRMTEPRKVLRADEQAVVADRLGQLVRWPGTPSSPWPHAYAAAVEPTHVHLLVGPVEEPIDRYAGRLKGTSSSAVLALPADPPRRHTWTVGYWKVFLFDHEGMYGVRDYIEQHNLRRDLPAAPFPWLSPLDAFAAL